MELVSTIWPIVLASIGFVFWLGRLEGKVAVLEASDSRTLQKLDGACESLARIEGHLGLTPKINERR